ncbi:MAG: hypothetical protein J6B07_00215 [Opitutales bacterium]|nr:hypothetical protein [Opitutales bacterium]
MKYLKSILLFVSLIVLTACSSDTQTNAQLQKEEFDNSISNLRNAHFIDDVNTKFMTDDQTRTIYEVFTGKEFGHGKLILRTDNTDRTGLYFFVMFNTYKYNIQKGSQILLYFQTKDSNKNYKFSYTIPETSSLFRELVLGVTGKDALNLEKEILAWKIEVKAPDGKMITQKKSWLWTIENPPSPEVTPASKRPTLYLPNFDKKKK